MDTGILRGLALSMRFHYLRVGDTVELTIEGIGTQRQQLQQA